MNNPINITPSPEELDELLKSYRSQEKLYPIAKPPRPNRVLYYLIIIVVIITAPLAIFFVILRLPLITIRKLRLKYLAWSDERWFRKEMDWDPDTEGREYHFNEPPLKSTFKEKELQKERNDLNRQTETLKQEWIANSVDVNKLMNYAVYQSTTNHYNGQQQLLYILHQLKQQHLEGLKQDYLYWNFCVACNKLKLYNQSEHYKQLAIKHGFNGKTNHTSSSFGLLSGILVSEAANYFYRDLINVWPRLR